jgi:hypothetical protein
MTAEAFTEMALSFPGTELKPHFERVGFRVIGKTMFATYLPAENAANVFLAPAEQAVFCQMDGENIYPVPNRWGQKGATTFELDQVSKEVVLEALLSAYNKVLRRKKVSAKKP